MEKKISSSKRKRRNGDVVEESKMKKKRKSIPSSEGNGDETETVDDREEHSRLLGLVTGQMKKLPLEDKTQGSGESMSETPGKKKKKKHGGGHSDDQGETGSAANCEKSSVDKASASEYLVLWDSDRANWSFRKKTQYWLLQNMYFKESLSKSEFGIMLRYLEGLQGNQRKLVLEKAKDLIKENEPIEDEVPGAKWTYKRAIKVSQVFSN